jgi:hypothetical protein
VNQSRATRLTRKITSHNRVPMRTALTPSTSNAETSTFSFGSPAPLMKVSLGALSRRDLAPAPLERHCVVRC